MRHPVYFRYYLAVKLVSCCAVARRSRVRALSAWTRPSLLTTRPSYSGVPVAVVQGPNAMVGVWAV